MASEAPINGNYAPHQGYGSIEQNHAAYTSGGNSHAAYSNSTQSAAVTNTGASEIAKDEVGWYFVEQYYTTLSRTPERLYVSLPPCPLEMRCARAHDCIALLQQAFTVPLWQ